MQFNARSETVAEKGVFSKLLSRQRCIVFMNGFYEWKKVCSVPGALLPAALTMHMMQQQLCLPPVWRSISFNGCLLRAFER